MQDPELSAMVLALQNDSAVLAVLARPERTREIAAGDYSTLMKELGAHWRTACRRRPTFPPAQNRALSFLEPLVTASRPACKLGGNKVAATPMLPKETRS